ncbi:MAG: hypothetical protein CK429_19065 [Mycobacterium sp.]|uniref:hypothetical protein n=1 Tax=Mycobacterium gordonae TaxID=1778 RepID=UPI000CC28BDF|nr:hypothetical protein [Mycobacterium gordonae]MCQ4364632.1 hypothetical protein [Mycobacterium gordonae]PJE10330.1 MAG: hypothetical protein CK429_19065 [Mycobacterium sp.]
MAGRLDVAGRLAEGLPAVEHMQSYLRACQQIGYRDPELNGDPAQIRDWYASEDGLDLRALDSDCAALRAAGSVISEALRLLRDQLTVLATAWTGPGADAAVAFLRRHCDIADGVVAEVRAAAQRGESLRDNLWHLVDGKVATTITIDDRTLAQRPTWLAAAAAVTTDAAARDVVDQHIKPFVDNDIRHDLRTALLSARRGVTAAYDTVVDRFAAAPRAYFEVPGDFQPLGRPPAPVTARIVPAISAAPAISAVPAAAPAQASVPATVTASPPASVPASTATQPESGAGWAADPGAAGGVGSGGGLGGFGGLGDLASRIVAGMGDLLGSAADPSADDPFDTEDHRDHPDRLEKNEEAREPEAARPHGEGAEASPPVGVKETAAGVPASALPPAAPAATEPPVSVPVADPPPHPKPTGSTPCEIAANELPQAGQ